MRRCKRKLFSRRKDNRWEGSLGATKLAVALPSKRTELGESRREGRGEVPHAKSFEQIKGNNITPAFVPLEKE